MSEPTLIDKAEALKLVNPKRKLLLLALIIRAEREVKDVLPATGAPFFDFEVCPFQMMTLLECNVEVMISYMGQLVAENYIDAKANYSNPLEWVYVVNLRPLMQRSEDD